METNDLISVLSGEYGPLFNSIEMWACIKALGVKPMRNSETGYYTWAVRVAENAKTTEGKQKNM